jgi:TetR/AcrR family transcriptional regulator, repressor for uid operon
MQVNVRATTRERQRLETRERVFEAAVSEMSRTGLADADVNAIVAEAGVAKGTFYFHFPTKEHVFDELERRLEQDLADELRRYLARPRDLRSLLREIARLIERSHRRQGPVLFKEMFVHHFVKKRPGMEEWIEYPLIALLIDEVRDAQQRGEVAADVDAVYSAQFFLLGVYVLMTTDFRSVRARADVIGKYVEKELRGLGYAD